MNCTHIKSVRNWSDIYVFISSSVNFSPIMIINRTFKLKLYSIWFVANFFWQFVAGCWWSYHVWNIYGTVTVWCRKPILYLFVSFNYCYFPEWFWRLKWETKILKLIQCSMTYKLCFYGASACVSILYSCVKLNPPLVHLHSLAYSTSIESKLHTVFSDKRGLVIEVVNPPQQ